MEDTKLPRVVAVIGAGTMGHALALVHALGGCTVRVHDTAAEVLARAPDLVAAALETLRIAGALDADAAEAAIAQILYTDSLGEAVADADLIVEAVVEKADVKRAVYAEIDAQAPAEAILASNTSYLDVFPLVPAARAPRTAIAHWYTPPYLIDLVDIVPGPETDRATIDTLRRLYEGFGKEPVVFKRHVPGYVANRLQMALHLECLRMIAEGWAGPEEIDRSILHGLAGRMAVLGHMKKMDFTGLQMVRNGIASRMYEPPENTGETPVLDRLIDANRSGVIDGAGFYDYDGRTPQQLFRDRDLQLYRMREQIRAITRGEDE